MRAGTQWRIGPVVVSAGPASLVTLALVMAVCCVVPCVVGTLL